MNFLRSLHFLLLSSYNYLPSEMAMEEDSDNEDEVGPQPPNPNEANLDSSANLGPPKPQVGEVANQILFCSDLPTEITDDMLGVLFQQ